MKTNSGESILEMWDWKVDFQGASAGAWEGMVEAIVRLKVRVRWARRVEAMVAVWIGCEEGGGFFDGESVKRGIFELLWSFLLQCSSHCELTKCC